MPFDAEEAELLSATQSLCRWTPGADDSSPGSVSALSSTVDSLRAVELFLRRDHPSLQPHHRSLGRWRTVQTALLPLMTTYKRDREVVYPVMKLLVRLTMALPADSEADSRRERTGHQRLIRSAMLDGAHLDVLMQWLTPLLARPPAIRSVDDVNLIELSLTLIKNLLAISASANTQSSSALDDGLSSKAEAQSSHSRPVGERIIRRYAECGVLDMLAAVCWQPEDLSQFGLLLLETVAHLCSGVSVDELVAEQRRTEREEEMKRQKEQSAAAGTRAAHNGLGQFSYLWKGQSQSSNSSALAAPPSTAAASPSSLAWQLQTVRLNERSRQVAPSRHSRFGTLLTLPSPLLGSIDSELSAPPLSSGTQLVRNMFDMHAMGSDNLPSFRGRTPRQTHSATAAAAVSSTAGERSVCVELVQFLVQFISDGGYGRLMDSAVSELRANVRVVRDDEKNWMTVAALMMAVWREQQTNIARHEQQHNKENVSHTDASISSDALPLSPSSPAPHFQCEPVMSCLSSTAFSLLTSKLLLYILEKPSPLPFLTASLHLYSEVVHTLSCMLRTASPSDRERANELRHSFYYEKEQLDLLVSLMRQWNAHAWGGQLMALLVECVHWSMQMLDDVDGQHTISQRKKKRVVKNRTVLVDGAKQRMAIADLQFALPANVIVDANTHNQPQQQDEQHSSEQQQEAVPVMALAVTELTEIAGQHEAKDSSTKDDSEQSNQQEETMQSSELQADTIACDSEQAHTLTTHSTALVSLDSQAATLPLSAASIDSAAETIQLLAADNSCPAETAEGADSVDSSVATQAAPSIHHEEAQSAAVDSQAQTIVLADEAIPDSAMDAIATQLLPLEDIPHGDNAGDYNSLHDAQYVDVQSVPPPASPPSVDISDASLSTLVSEMAIQPLDVVMDSMAADDTRGAADRDEQVGEHRTVEQQSVDSQPAPSTDVRDHDFSGVPTQHGDAPGAARHSMSSLLQDDVSPDTIIAQQADSSADEQLAMHDEHPSVDFVPIVASGTTVPSPTLATVVLTHAAVGEADAVSSTSPTDLAELVETDEDGYFRMEATFNFSAYLLSYANPTILSHYLTLLAAYRTNSASLNAHIIHFLSRIAFDRQLMPMLFQLSALQLCDSVLNDQQLKKDKHDERWRELTSFCKKIVRAFFDWTARREERGEMMFVECLFWKTVNAVELMRGGYRGGHGEDRDDVDDGEHSEARQERQDEVAWEAELQAQADGDWQPGKPADPAKGAVKKYRSARSKQKRAEVGRGDDDGGEEIDIAALMEQQAAREAERVKREKKEQRRREVEARERERDKQRRALMTMEDDEEEELQLGEYDEQEMEERRKREQRERDEAAEAEGAEKEWQTDEEELLRTEYPLFTALKSRYALMSSRLHSRFTQAEVRRKIEQLGLDADKSENTTDALVPSSLPRLPLQAEMDLHTATTDEERSELDTSEMVLVVDAKSPSAPTSPISMQAPPPSPSDSVPSILVPSTRGSRAPTGPVVDVKSITGAVYDLVTAMTRYEHHRTFIQQLIQTLAACAQRRQHELDWKRFAAATLSPSRTADESTLAGERKVRRQRQLLSSLQLVRVAGGAWSVQRQYTADKLEAVVATIERAYGNTMDDMAEQGEQLPMAEEEEEDVEEEPITVQQSAEDEQQEADDEADELAAGAIRRGEEASIALSTPRETRKRTAAQLGKGTGSGTSSEPSHFTHAEDEMDDSELAEFLRQKRNRLPGHTPARSAPQQPQTQQTPHAEDNAASLTAAGRAQRGRLRKAAGVDGQEEEERDEPAQPVSYEVPAIAEPDTEIAMKRRRVIIDDEDDEMAAT